MHQYQFPHITHISQCLEAIAGCDSFIVAERDRHTIINYVAMGNDTFPDVTPPVESWFGTSNRGPYMAALRRECRGIVFGPDGQVIARRYHKFFNAGEREEMALGKIDVSLPHVILDKLDGSMITPIPIGEHIRWGTKMGLTGVGFQAEEWVAKHGRGRNYVLMAEHYRDCGWTPIFEWCSRKQRIVVDYPNDDLVLTAIRNNITGKYLSYADLHTAAKFWGVSVVGANTNKVLDMEQFVDYVNTLGRAGDFEGFVIRFDSGHMVKIKTEDYVRIHRAKDSILQEKRTVEMVLNEKVDDVLPHLQAHDKKALENFQMDFWKGVLNLKKRILVFALNWRRDVKGDRRQFAIDTANGVMDPQIRSVIFSVWDKLDVQMEGAIFAELTRRIGSNLGSQSKVEGARWMWGGVRWADYIGAESDDDQS